MIEALSCFAGRLDATAAPSQLGHTGSTGRPISTTGAGTTLPPETRTDEPSGTATASSMTGRAIVHEPRRAPLIHTLLSEPLPGVAR